MSDQDSLDEDITVDKAMELYQAAVTAADEAAANQAEIEKSQDLVAITSSPDSVRAKLIESRSSLRLAQEKINSSKKALDNAVARQRAEMERKITEMNALLQPMKAQMAKLSDGIDAMNLYMGRDEFIHTIREGEKAPKETPLVIRQRVLAMDEETALNAESGGMDAMDIDKFDQWLLEDPAHVQQVIPEPKSVVVLRVRATEKRYEDPWQAIVMNAANEETWWLIRNGDSLYRMVTEFQVGTHLVPKADEFTSLFSPYDQFTKERVELKPGTQEWIKAERSADVKTRHYMKIALILQGLIDRSDVLRPLSVSNLSVVDNSFYDEGYVRVITDAEMAIETQLQPFRSWLRDKNSKVVTGTRVMFGRITTNSYESGTISPRYASSPHTGEVYVVGAENLKETTLSVSYDREDTIWSDDAHDFVVPKTKAKYHFSKGDNSYVAIDFVTVEEMEAYLNSRSQRHDYEPMFPLLRNAIKFKKSEVAAETDFRALIKAELEKLGSSETEADLVMWWKTAHKWNRPLLGDPAFEAKAAKGILQEAKRRLSAVANAHVLDDLKSTYPDAVAILIGSSGYVVLVPEVYSVKHSGIVDNAYVRRIDTNTRGIVKKESRWLIPTKSQLAKLTLAYSAPEWNDWAIGANPDAILTEDDYRPLVSEVIERAESTIGSRVVRVSVTDFGNYDWIGASISAYMEHSPVDLDAPLKLVAGFPSLVSKKISYRIRKSRGIVSFERGYHGEYKSDLTDEHWRVTHNDLINPMYDSGRPQAPWEGYGKTAEPVWVNDELLAEEMGFAERYNKRKIAFAELDDKADKLISSVVSAWKESKIESMRIRYIEDFGDEYGWEDYIAAKTRNMQFPYPNSVDKYNYSRQRKNDPHTLRWLVARLVEIGQAPYGKTVQEAYNEAQLLTTNTDSVDLPDEIRDLRFMDEESSAVVKA
jgi:hypothetical protein